MRWTELFTKTQRDTDLRQSNSCVIVKEFRLRHGKYPGSSFSLPRVALRGNGLSSPELRHFAANCIWWSNREHSLKRKVGRAWQVRKHADFVFSTKRMTKNLYAQGCTVKVELLRIPIPDIRPFFALWYFIWDAWGSECSFTNETFAFVATVRYVQYLERNAGSLPLMFTFMLYFESSCKWYKGHVRCGGIGCRIPSNPKHSELLWCKFSS